MTETARWNKAKIAAGDINFGISTFTQASVLQTDGTIADQTADQVNASHIPLTSDTISTLGGSVGDTVEDALIDIAGGSAIQYATTAQRGQVYRMSAAPATVSQPIAIEQNDARVGRIPSANVYAALTGGTSAWSGNLYITQADLNNSADVYGTGKDGPFKVGVVTDPGTDNVSTLATATTYGSVPAGTYTYKICYGNATGTTLGSTAASAAIVVSSTGYVSGVLPVSADSDCAWRRIYRENGSGTYRLVKHVPNNTDTTFEDTMPFGGDTIPGLNTTNAAWGSPQGEWHFDGNMTVSAALAVSTTTINGGVLKIRCRGTVTVSANITANGAITPPTAAPWVLYDAAGPANFGRNGYTNTTGYGGKGTGVLYQLAGTAGKGSDGTVGAGGAAGTGGLPGGRIEIYAHRVIVDADITANGANGSDASGGTSSGGGGGGPGGMVVLYGRDGVWIKTGRTVSANGGDGGASVGSGGASTVTGAGGGGGGYVFIITPCYLNEGTVEAALGTKTADNNSASAAASGGGGGAHAGNGGNAGSDGTAGQVITSTTTAGTYLSAVPF